MHNKSKILILIVIAICVVFISFFSGRYQISPLEVLRLISWKITGGPTSVDNASIILFNIRTPRIIAAFLIGAALSVSGCAYQGIFRNPMASPDIMGATAGAGFGAALGILLSLNALGVQVFSFVFGLIAVFIAYIVANLVGTKQNMTLTLVLCGISISALFQACISITKFTADPFNKLPAITYWLMGSVSSVAVRDLYVLIPVIVVGIVPLIAIRWRLNVMAFSDEEAQSMGINVSSFRIIIIVAATLTTSAAVAMSGIIGWVGLIVPHVARMIVGSNYKILLPTSALVGGIYLLVVDNLARGVSALEIPLGILTALVGVPFFIYLMYRGKQDTK